MTKFAEEPVGIIEVKCKSCGGLCKFSGQDRFCPKCGKQLAMLKENLLNLKSQN